MPSPSMYGLEQHVHRHLPAYLDVRLGVSDRGMELARFES